MIEQMMVPPWARRTWRKYKLPAEFEGRVERVGSLFFRADRNTAIQLFLALGDEQKRRDAARREAVLAKAS